MDMEHAEVNFPLPVAGEEHVGQLSAALSTLDLDTLARWGALLHKSLSAGARLLVAGNGGSAAEAQHLTAELVGRFHRDRRPFSAIALHTDTSSLTAIANDYSYADVFARQVEAHGRPGDILLLLSVSGNSLNVQAAARSARQTGMATWALTGTRPNGLTELCDEVVVVTGGTAVVQELHLIAVHLICESFEQADLATPPAVPGVSALTGSVRGAPASVRADPKANGRKVRRRSDSAERLLVIGDIVLDRDIQGRVARLSPEAPVPVVDSMTTSIRPGGAALAAVFATRLGKKVTLLTAQADDAAGRELRAQLDAAQVQMIDLGLTNTTPVKTRIRAADRSLLMLDDASPARTVWRSDSELMRQPTEQFGAILVADYGRGITAVPSVRELVATAAGQIPVVWDPHPRGSEPVAGVRVVTPNGREAANFATTVAGNWLGTDIERARILLRRWSVAGVAVTLGERGAVLIEDPELTPLVVPVPKLRTTHQALDACGAGDFFAAVTAGLLAEGALLSEAVTTAVAAASEYVASGGPGSLDDGLVSPSASTDSLDGFELARLVRARGGTVVAAGGCFDLLHYGHVRLLEQARGLGDCLIVCLNSDESIARLKGPDRPVVTLSDRATVLRALEAVDAVVVFGEDTPLLVLDELRPDIYVKGGDYTDTVIPEEKLIHRWGGQVVTLPYLDGRSTTSLISRAAKGTVR